MSEKNITPTPWARSMVKSSGKYTLWTDSVGFGRHNYIGYISNEKNADFILHAVNTFVEREALVKDLQKEVEQLNKMVGGKITSFSGAIKDELIKQNELITEMADALQGAKSAIEILVHTQSKLDNSPTYQKILSALKKARP